MTDVGIAQLSRESKNTVLRGILANDPSILGHRPKLTAYKILDKEFDAEGLWYWYKVMADSIGKGIE